MGCELQGIGTVKSVLLDARRFTAKMSIRRSLSLGMGAIALIAGCSQSNLVEQTITFNSRYTDEQPALSGDGRYVAFVSNRDGDRKIVMYDLRRRLFVDLPLLNQSNAIAESPSLSRTGRYIAYIVSERGRPEIRLYDRAVQRSQAPIPGYPGWVRNPSISPDGRYLVFETSRRGQWDVEVLDRGPNVELDISDGSTISSP